MAKAPWIECPSGRFLSAVKQGLDRASLPGLYPFILVVIKLLQKWPSLLPLRDAGMVIISGVLIAMVL